MCASISSMKGILHHLFFTFSTITSVEVAVVGSNNQGSKFSDFSLISDFFPTPSTILEISVNLKRIFSFLKGRAATIKFIASHDFDMVKPTLPPGIKKTMALRKKRTPNLCKTNNFYYRPTIHRGYL